MRDADSERPRRPPRLARCGMALAVMMVIGGCASVSGAPGAPITPTAWPTLAPLGTMGAGGSAVAAPQLVEQYRVDVTTDAVAIFPLLGQIDHPVRVEVIVLAGDLDPVITISNNAGDQLASANRGSSGEPEVIGQFQFPGDGYYQLGIGSASGSGQVGVSVYQLDLSELEGGGVFSSNNEELHGSMTHPASYHTFRLPLVRGQRIDLWASALTPDLDLLMEVYGPDGILVAARDDNVGKDPYLWNFMPGQSGTYTVVLSNYDEHTGDYTLSVAPSQSGGAAQMSARTPLELSASPRRSTWLTLQGVALDAIRVETRPLVPGMDIVITLYDPYCNRLLTVDKYGAGEPEQITLAQFPFDGEYQLEFATTGEGGTMEYYVRPLRGVDLGMGGRTAQGGRVQEGDIVGPGTLVAYVFDADAGDLVGVDAHATD